MKIDRTKNGIRNMIFGIIAKIYQLVIPFFMRTIIIYAIGIQYLGLNSLFSSILSILNLAELGVGGAMVYSMYKPIASDDTVQLCALMNLYKKYYRVIGGVIGFAGITVAPFLKLIITGDIPPDINIYVLYIMHLTTTVFSYWLFAYKNSLLIAYQRNDISSKISICISTLQYGFQIVILLILKNYYLFLLVSLASQLFNNIITAVIVEKMYPHLQAKGVLETHIVSDINKRVKDLFTAKIGGVLLNSADSIIISIFFGLTEVAVYYNYYYIETMVASFIAILFSSVTAGIGNSLVTESDEKNRKDLYFITFVTNWLVCVSVCCMLLLYQPFMNIWVGPQYMLKYYAVIGFASYLYSYEMIQMLSMIKDAAGIWHQDRLRPLIAAFTNLILNLILMNKYGVYGVIFASVITRLVLECPWIIYNIFKYIYKTSPQEYIRRLIQNAVIMVIIAFVCCIISKVLYFEGFAAVIYNLIIAVIVSNTLLILLYKDTVEFKKSMNIINNILHNKLLKKGTK